MQVARQVPDHMIAQLQAHYPEVDSILRKYENEPSPSVKRKPPLVKSLRASEIMHYDASEKVVYPFSRKGFYPAGCRKTKKYPKQPSIFDFVDDDSNQNLESWDSVKTYFC